MHNDIPLARGLGSSAAATVGGLLAGNALVGEALSMSELLGLACAIEGHPDNAAAALLGGFVVSAAAGGADGVDAIRFDAPRDLRAVLFIPELRLPTHEMRAALPSTVPLTDAVANLSAVAIGVAGLAIGRYELLSRLTVDRLHEPYRAAVYPQLPRMVTAAREAGAIGAFLSGAGSTILAFTDSMAGITRIEGCVHRCRGGLGPAGHGASRRAAQRRRADRLPFLSIPQAVCVPMKPRTSPQAASLASANSAALRSKKLWGAPS